jgi:hypothetical protein
MKFKTEFIEMGNEISQAIGKMLVEEMEQNPEQAALLESFKEDNTMGNSQDLYTTVLGKKIYYTAYNNFKVYQDAVISLTPADVGMPEGAGAYKIPKILGSTAAKLVDGQVVQYLNDLKDSVTLETDTYGIGTLITRRLVKRGAKGFIQKLLTAASDSVQRAVWTDVANGMVAAADSANTITGGVSYDNIEEAKYKVKMARNSKGELYGFNPNSLALSALGMKTLLQSTDFKNVMYRNQVPGTVMNNEYTVWQGLRVMPFDLISVQKGGADVHAIVFDSEKYFLYLQETGIETFDGRLPGTAGNVESIVALDAGFVALAIEAASVITA